MSRGRPCTLTQDEVKALLHYDQETGIFHWLRRHSNHCRPNLLAGTPCDGYNTIRIGGRCYGAHRLAWIYMTGEVPKLKVDHRNGVRDDNRWTNLRLATDFQNTINRKVAKNSKSGVTGVTWRKREGKWRAQLKAYGKTNYLGRFDTKDEAAAAYARAAREIFGEYARAA